MSGPGKTCAFVLPLTYTAGANGGGEGGAGGEGGGEGTGGGGEGGGAEGGTAGGGGSGQLVSHDELGQVSHTFGTLTTYLDPVRSTMLRWYCVAIESIRLSCDSPVSAQVLVWHRGSA